MLDSKYIDYIYKKMYSIIYTYSEKEDSLLLLLLNCSSSFLEIDKTLPSLVCLYLNSSLISSLTIL